MYTKNGKTYTEKYTRSTYLLSFFIVNVQINLDFYVRSP